MTKGSLDERTIRRKSLPTVETRTLSLFSSSLGSSLGLRTYITKMMEREKNPNKEMKNYNSKKEDLEEEDQRQDERNVIL